MKILNCTLIAFIVLGLTPVFGQDATVSYKTNADGSITRLVGTTKIKDTSMLQAKRTAMDAQCDLFDGLATMTPDQLQAAHALWEKYREPITKGVITIPQAIENITADIRKEIAAMDAVLK